MTEESAATHEIQGCLDRLRAGDASARNELLERVGGRLERLAHKMLLGFPGVRRWEQTDDVLQNALIRLTRALAVVQPTSVRQFFALGAEQIRRELLDLAKHYFGPQGAGTHHVTESGRAEGQLPLHEPANRSSDPELLAAWCEFHRQVQMLAEDEREVIDLLFYQELTQIEAAGILNVNVRTVQRRWQSALLKLHAILQSQWPGL